MFLTPEAAGPSSRIDASGYEALQRSTVDFVLGIFGSLENIPDISTEFFTGTHQRIPAISKHRFNRDLQSLTTNPRADFAALCLCILLLQQRPAGRSINMQPALYFHVKHLITMLESTNGPSLDLVHCRVLVTFYEMGHGLHATACISLTACVRSARVIGLHRKYWRNLVPESDMLAMEEDKRTWWAIIAMDRFINLCNGDSVLTSNDPETTDPLPIEDLLWSESSRRRISTFHFASPLAQYTVQHHRRTDGTRVPGVAPSGPGRTTCLRPNDGCQLQLGNSRPARAYAEGLHPAAVQ